MMTKQRTVFKAWNTKMGRHDVEIEVPHNRESAVYVTFDADLPEGHYTELARGGRVLAETPGGKSCTTESGWVIARS